MSFFAWLGIFFSAMFSTLAINAYAVMSMPYYDTAAPLIDLKKHSRKALAGIVILFGLFFLVYFLAAHLITEANSGPLCLFATLTIALPMSLLLGSETWARYDARGMNKARPTRAVAIATGIGLGELAGVLGTIALIVRLAS